MAIDAYVGKPGHGKSYSVTERVIIPSLKQGRHVVTNIPLNQDDLLADFGGTICQLPDDWHLLEDLSDYVKNGCVLILDELWRRWPSGQQANKANPWDKSLLAEHRHMVDSNNRSMRIVLVTQDLSQISHWARILVENTYRMVKLSKKVYRVDVYSGFVTGDSPPASKRIRQYPGRFNASIQRYYKSAIKSETGEVGDESKADSSSSILRSYGLWSALIFAVLGLAFGFFGIKSFLFKTAPEQPKPINETPLNSETPPKPLKPLAPVPPPYSTKWRLSGFVLPSEPSSTGRDFSVALLTDSSGSTRFISFSSCRFFADFKEAYCDVDGERITSWTAQSSASSMPPIIGGLVGGTSERSVSRPAD